MSRAVRRVRVPGSLAEHAQQHIGHIDMDAPEVVMLVSGPRGDIVRFGTVGLRVAVMVRSGRVDSLQDSGKLSVPCVYFNRLPVMGPNRVPTRIPAPFPTPAPRFPNGVPGPSLSLDTVPTGGPRPLGRSVRWPVS
jgi:hypothetical protein